MDCVTDLGVFGQFVVSRDILGTLSDWAATNTARRRQSSAEREAPREIHPSPVRLLYSDLMSNLVFMKQPIDWKFRVMLSLLFRVFFNNGEEKSGFC